MLICFDLPSALVRLTAGELACPLPDCAGALGAWGYARERTLRLGPTAHERLTPCRAALPDARSYPGVRNIGAESHGKAVASGPAVDDVVVAAWVGVSVLIVQDSHSGDRGAAASPTSVWRGVGRIAPGRGRRSWLAVGTVAAVGDTMRAKPDDGSTHWTTLLMAERRRIVKTCGSTCPVGISGTSEMSGVRRSRL
jgi:hypothetical protein